jgi:hypothetical protein
MELPNRAWIGLAGFYGFNPPRVFSGAMHDPKSRAHADFCSSERIKIGKKSDAISNGFSQP